MRITPKYTPEQRAAFDRAIAVDGMTAAGAARAAAAGTLGVDAFTMPAGTARHYAQKARRDATIAGMGTGDVAVETVAQSAAILAKAHAVLCRQAANRAAQPNAKQPTTPADLTALAKAGAAIADLQRATRGKAGHGTGDDDGTTPDDAAPGLVDTLAADV